MKAIHEATEPTQFPQFWDEEWLQIAIQELDKRAFTPEERMVYEMTISANAVVVRNERKKIDAATMSVKTEAVMKALQGGKLTTEDIAAYNDVSVDFVKQVQQEISAGKQP